MAEPRLQVGRHVGEQHSIRLQLHVRTRRVGLAKLGLRLAQLLRSKRIARLAISAIRAEYSIGGGRWRPLEIPWSHE
jgi:hypothetical protein